MFLSCLQVFVLLSPTQGSTPTQKGSRLQFKVGSTSNALRDCYATRINLRRLPTQGEV